jgi:glutamate-1-semialdehyde 2,1-aminomutase
MSLATNNLLNDYRQRTPGSAALAARARQVFPSGVTHDSRYLEPYPIYVTRAAGSRKWDVDGNEYVDYAGGHGALLLGHNHATVVRAVETHLHRGTHYGCGHELEVRWGELVRELVPCAERVRFTSSGTEATLLGLRLARAFTGRPKLLRFAGHFHGWQDHVAFGVNNHYDGTPTPGVLSELAGQVLLAEPGNVEQVRRLLHGGEVAAVIIEPTGASWGQVPVLPDFLHALRELTEQHGTVLIFDEVISGFRCSPGGAQAALGITPDLTTLAKIVAGGLPGGAIVGKQSIMDALDFAAGPSVCGEKVPHNGTFNANPLSAAAGIATLEIVASTDACARANEYARQLRAALQRVLFDEQVPWVVYGTYSGFHIFTNPDKLPVAASDIEAGRYDYRVLKRAVKADVMRLRVGMLAHGVELFAWPGGPTSAVHDHDDLQRTVEAFRHTVRRMRDES